MIYALISDIHANLPALEAVLDDVGLRDVGATYHLGDLVGHAPWPALIGGLWQSHWLYWVAPVTGMMAAGWAYDFLRPADGGSLHERISRRPPVSREP